MKNNRVQFISEKDLRKQKTNLKTQEKLLKKKKNYKNL